jgi:peptide/nickel transport system substrate-binding protein
VKRYLRVLALVAVLGLVAAACGGDDDGEPGQTGTTGTETGATGETGADIQPGGTLEMAMLGDVSAAFDPQKEYYSVTWEYYRCCLLRTLLSYTGMTTAEGGGELQPDIASALPEISSDGLTYTFTLKSGVNYAPPFEDVSVTSQDIIRAIERTADPDASVNGYSFYYSIIDGFDDFGAGDADTIAGLTAPDESTLVVELNTPAGYLPYLFSMHASAPIPPDGADEPLGAAEGHTRDYGRFLVATGPYMFAGSENMDFSLPADEQTPVAGYEPGQSIQLVRNPSWDPATDTLRPAYVDGMNISIGGDNNDLYNQILAGELDLVVDGIVPPQVLRQYSTDPTLQPYLHINASDAVRYISFNLAVPPFDDVHVRKAFNLALDKEGMRTLRGGETVGEIAGHIFVNSLQNNLLVDYDPYATPNSAGDIAAAQAEMAQSVYDTDGDGVCDAPECSAILSLTDEADPYPDQAALIQQNMEPLGLSFDVKSFERTTMYSKCNDPSAQAALCMGPGWGKDFPDGYTFADPLFGSAAIFPSCCNYGLVGASADLLTENDYSVTEVPSVDDQIAEANAQTGDARFQSWADLDQTLMEEVVPWVPYLEANTAHITGPTVTQWQFDQFSTAQAYAHVAVDASQQ